GARFQPTRALAHLLADLRGQLAIVASDGAARHGADGAPRLRRPALPARREPHEGLSPDPRRAGAASGVSGAVGAPRRWLFAATILTGSFLLFLVQPMVARMALPRLGGAPNVWNSAMLVYQALLLGGYAYAHGI